MFLLFDLDRTLWDFEGNAEITFRKMFAHFDLGNLCRTDYETFHDKYREVNAMLWDAYRNGTLSKEVLYVQRFIIPLEFFGVTSPGVLSRQLGDYYVLEGPKQTGLMPGTRELLEWLSATDHTLCIITNGFSEAQLPKMISSKIDHYFSHFFLSEDIGFMKPDVRFFNAVVDRLGTSADQCMVIGDDFDVDIVGARKAGIDQVFYNPTGVDVEKKAFRPTYTIRHLSEFQQLLGSLK